MNIIFQNELGRVVLSGGGFGASCIGKTAYGESADAGDAVWRIIRIVGLNLAPKLLGSVKYAGVDGCDTICETVSSRTITISGDIRNNRQLQREIGRSARIFSRKGTLYLTLGGKRRKIDCRVLQFDADSRNGAAAPFVLQLLADDPAFLDIEPTCVAVFSRKDRIASPFKLPMIFSQRISEADLFNMGDIKAEPVFYLRNPIGGGASRDGEMPINGEYTIICNTTTNQKIQLTTCVLFGELVTVDIPNRIITSDMRGNMLRYITNDTFLGDFWLQTGINHIQADTSVSGHSMSVVCEFVNRFVEATY